MKNGRVFLVNCFFFGQLYTILSLYYMTHVRACLVFSNEIHLTLQYYEKKLSNITNWKSEEKVVVETKN